MKGVPVVIAVVCATFDDRLAGAVVARMERLAAAGLRVTVPPRHPPHLTLSAARVESAGDVAGVVVDVARRHAPFAVTLDHLGIFPRGVLWLGPRPDPRLATLQRACDEAMTARWPRAFGGQDEPGHWIAHCTLATRLEHADLARAVRVVARPRSLQGTITALSTIVVGGTGVYATAPLAEGDAVVINSAG